MDLLGGYGSDSDSDASSSSSVPVATPAAASQSKPAVSTTPTPPSTALPPPKNKENDASKRGKRLLRLNLNAVLPPEILKRLTKSTVQGVGDDDSDSESDSGSDGQNENDNRNGTPSRRIRNGSGKKNKNKIQSAIHSERQIPSAADQGLNSLLSDLNGFTPATTPMMSHKQHKSSLMTRPSTDIDTASATEEKSATTQQQSLPKNNKKEKETLGMAFMNVSTTVVRKKRNDNGSSNVHDVVDIHGSGHKGKVLVEDVDSDSDSDAEGPTVAKPQIMFPVKRKEEPSSKPLTSGSTAPSAASSSSSLRSRMNFSIPRPAAAPSTGMYRAAAPNATPGISSSSSYYTATPQIHHNNNATTASMAKHQITTQQQPQSQPNKKRSKRELEKALRAGNLESINLQQYTNNTQSLNSINYNPQNQTQLLSSADTGSGGAGGGGGSYHAGGLEHYVPSEGTSVKGFSGKMRGKHQIHSLVQSAAKLEADQRRIDAMSGGMGVGKGKSSRADAKRKYGW